MCVWIGNLNLFQLPNMYYYILISLSSFIFTYGYIYNIGCYAPNLTKRF